MNKKELEAKLREIFERRHWQDRRIDLLAGLKKHGIVFDGEQSKVFDALIGKEAFTAWIAGVQKAEEVKKELDKK